MPWKRSNALLPTSQAALPSTHVSSVIVSHHSATISSLARARATATLVDSGHGLTVTPGDMSTLVDGGVFPRRAHDDDGALGVVDTLLTDGAEQQASEPAMSTRPDHQEVTRCGGAYQDRGCLTLDDLPLDLDVRRLPDGLADRRLERLFSLSSKITGTGTGRVERTDETEVVIAP